VVSDGRRRSEHDQNRAATFAALEAAFAPRDGEGPRAQGLVATWSSDTRLPKSSSCPGAVGLTCPHWTPARGSR